MSKGKGTVQGVREIQRAFKARRRATAKGLRRGLLKAGLFLQRESQKIVPIDTGNLRRSAFTREQGAGFDIVVTVGYTASYAIYVHERVELRHAPGKQAKFLEHPLREKRGRMAAIVVEEVEKEKL